MAKNELHRLVDDEELKDATLMLLVNKMDLKVMTAQEVSNNLNFDSIQNTNKKYFGVVGIKGEGLKEAMDWFADHI